MSAPKYFVVREVGGQHSQAFAVVEHGEGYTGLRGYKRKCLWVHGWYTKEDDARADAHRLCFPD